MKIYRSLIIINFLLLVSCKSNDVSTKEVTQYSSCSFSIDVDSNVRIEPPFFDEKPLSAKVITNGHCDLNSFRWQWLKPNEKFVIEGEFTSEMVIYDGPIGRYMFQLTASYKNQLLRVPVYINLEMLNAAI